MRRLQCAAIQLLAHDRSSFTRAWPAIAQHIRSAASQGAQLIVLPEGTLPAYVLGRTKFEDAEISQSIAECSELARTLRAVIVIGAARTQGGQVFNSAIVFDTDGSQAGSADKHFLWHFDRQWFAAGTQLRPVHTSLGELGVLICADGRIPTIASTLVDQGAQVLVMPTAWVTSGRDPSNLENVQADLLARVRARENGVPFIAANKCGVEMRAVAYSGKSQIVNADGSVAAIAPQDAPATIYAGIELHDKRSARKHTLITQRVRRGAEAPGRSVRIAISPYEGRGDSDLLQTLEAEALIAPDTIGSLDAILPDVHSVRGNSEVNDPAYLAACRRAGADMFVWLPDRDDGWQLAFARARALELRIYAIVLDVHQGRAYAVDPDGAIVCGTFGPYEIASFTYDPARTQQTLVAPGTDVREGLERAHAHAR